MYFWRQFEKKEESENQFNYREEYFPEKVRGPEREREREL